MAGQLVPSLFLAWEAAAERRSYEFSTQDLANTAWASATVGKSDGPLLCTLASLAMHRMGELKVQELANTVWAFATLLLSDATLFLALAKVSEWHMLACDV
eukprot:gnl/TRDRNA2_/TRDRNA2_149247_c1_seq1.p1 gnl/TRDRNA2_/TRDRNA2_149247_c1~~gnl/TRDRNA2_/TRDRNA2_149247_c1_seq1.p1  ORF type:complete len:101 (-),score=17.68 gnl/TRDRNA2_/TRDRNA2_149247_c1_seq1:98-400(-)